MTEKTKKIIEISEKEKEFKVYYEEKDENGEIITSNDSYHFQWWDDQKKWITNLRGDYDDEELKIIQTILNKLNEKKDRIKIDIGRKN